MISPRFFWIAIGTLLGVYGLGLFSTLMENDSAQFAVMAMRMVQEQDWLSLWKGPEEYLDKPHLHYWLAAISYTLFGIHDWAYRLPAFLAIALGTYSCYGLGNVLYSRNAGKIGALIFLSSQTIVLSGIDVRTDAVLTGCVALSLWKITAYLKCGKLSELLMGTLAAGLAFTTKGQIALVVIGLPVFIHLVVTREYQWVTFSRLLLALLVFALAITPMLVAYYQQFDLHPEKIIRGRGHRSGLLFIFWEQSFERLSGEGIGKNSSDYLFFFHTFLWVFLPWTFLGLAAYTNRIRRIWKAHKSKSTRQLEWMTAGGITIIFILISFAQFKLPHYLNILIPLFSVLTGGFLERQYQEGKPRWMRRAAKVQLGISLIFLLVIGLVLFWVFPIPIVLGFSFLLFSLVVGFVIWVRANSTLTRLLGITLYGAVLLNLVMNTHFYPKLLEYQAGSEMAKRINEESLEITTIYKLDQEHTWALDFYFKKPVVYKDMESLTGDETDWYYVNEKQRELLVGRGIVWDSERNVDQFRISRLQGRFLNPTTREQVLRKRYLLHVISSKNPRQH